jgi:vacuolar protein sorting-associated protein 13A/C
MGQGDGGGALSGDPWGLGGPQGQVMGVALSFLRNFGIFSGASGVLGALSASVATLAADDHYDTARAARQQERNITGVGEGLAEGGEALGAAFYRGFTGLISKPLEGAKRDGVGGTPPPSPSPIRL